MSEKHEVGEIVYTSDPSVEVNIHAAAISADIAVTILSLFRERVKIIS